MSAEDPVSVAAVRPRFPFSAVVGADDLKLALILVAVDPAIGGVLLTGQKGSAKTTLARALADLLPDRASFVELPLGATDDRLLGSIDLTAALTGGGVRFRPGLLADAHGGVLHVDEVNLLADHLVDSLLDVAVSGVNRVEREGVSHEHPARFVLVGSMNPEEGELRPQLLDRFGLSVEVVASTSPAERAEAVRRRLDFDRDPARFVDRWSGEQSDFRARLDSARPALVDDHLLVAVAGLCASIGAEGLRADLVTARAAAALAGWEGRADTTADDVRRVARLTLGHRRRRNPFDAPGVEAEDLDRALDEALGGGASEPSPSPPPYAPPPPGDGDGDDGPGPGAGEVGVGDGEVGAGAGGGHSPEPTAQPGGGPARPVVALSAPLRSGEGSGRRSAVRGVRGRTVGARAAGDPTAVAVGATVAAAARRTGGGAGPVTLERDDLREPVREAAAGNLVVVALDTSGSMGVERRVEVVSSALLGLLLDAYQQRDRVALVAFRGDDAEVVVRPTGSVEVARARLATIATGGRTPLAVGIDAALRVATTTPSATHHPLLVVVTDGRATSAPSGADPVAASLAAAASVRRRRVPAVVVDAEDGATRLGLARELADAMGARHLPLSELTPDSIRPPRRSTRGADR